jgi:enoyl-CoA hydratase/carnithine racemase
LSSELLSEIRGQVAFVTLNRPQALNSLTFAMVRELSRSLHAWERDDRVRAILIKGTGEKAFCAGGDVRSIYEMYRVGDPDHLNFFAEEYAMDHYVHRYPKPIVALMDGIVMGGGMGIAQGAAQRIATDRTRMAMPETTIGLFPDVGASYFLSRLDGALGVYLGITGKELRAPDILEAGLADRYLDAQSLVQLEAVLVEHSWSADPLEDVENLLQSLKSPARSEAALEPYWDVIDDHFSEASVPDIVASLRREERPPFQEWAKQTLALLERRSPTMMCVTRRQLELAKNKSLADCFRMELGMIHQCFKQGDFIEGVRALLIDKDNAPKWSPGSLDQVTEESVESFFRSQWTAEQHPLAALAP